MMIDNQIMGLLQPLVDKPFLRRQRAYFSEIPLEGRKAASGRMGKPGQGHVAHVVLVHELLDVYLVRLVEVEQVLVEHLVRLQQGEQ